MDYTRLMLCVAAVAMLSAATAEAAADATIDVAVDEEAELSFERHIHPIVRAQCLDCHGGEKVEAGLDLRLRHFMAEGGESGAAIVPGEPDESLLIEKIERGAMPADEREVSEQELETLKRWIAIGAPTARPEPKEIDDGLRIMPEDREHWAYQPIDRPDVPEVAEGAERVRTPIDAFVLDAMQEHGLSFADDADRATAARRLHLDLTGLPPDAELVDRFVADDEPGAWQRLVDAVLNSPHYGERWARHWLDVAGYADSEGYAEDDTVREHAWRYRDYVIDSLNADKPFDQFIVEQLAGDELVGEIEGDMSEREIEKLAATGFLRMAPDGTGNRGVTQVEARNQVVADTVEIVATSLLGVTVQCAQCHDHHFDAIRQEDYYRLRAIFEPALDVSDWQRPNNRRVSLYTQAEREEAERIEAEAQAVIDEKMETAERFVEEVIDELLVEKEIDEELWDPIREAYHTGRNQRTEEQEELLREYPRIRDLRWQRLHHYDREKSDALEEFDEKAAEIRANKPPESFLRALRERPDNVPTTYLLHRGEPGAHGDPVKPGEMQVLAPEDGEPLIPENDPDLPTTGRRLAYAQWLTSGEHPLVARVLVNRVWMHYFGRGIVDSPEDFGTQGRRPTHPELLDWLAAEFMASGWSLKHLHELIVSSTVYRQSSRGSESHYESIAPANELYWHMPVRRLEAEAVRDSILAATGKLETRVNGPPVAIAMDEVGQIVVGKELEGNANRFGGIESLGADDYRRSLYIQSRRSRPVTFLSTFDSPVMDTNCVRRDVSTDVNQALLMMNNDWVREQAHDMAERVREEAGDDLSDQIETAWRLALGRAPDADEAEMAMDFLQEQRSFLGSHPVRQVTSLSNLCQVLLGSNAFLYVD